MKILIVDDDPVSRKLLHKMLEAHGECVEAESGPMALAAFREAWESKKPFKLITLDIEMPGMDGTEVLYEIRAFEKQMDASGEKRAKIIMVTSHADKDFVITSIQAGCDDYILKPYVKETIGKKIGELIGAG